MLLARFWWARPVVCCCVLRLYLSCLARFNSCLSLFFSLWLTGRSRKCTRQSEPRLYCVVYYGGGGPLRICASSDSIPQHGSFRARSLLAAIMQQIRWKTTCRTCTRLGGDKELLRGRRTFSHASSSSSLLSSTSTCISFLLSRSFARSLTHSDSVALSSSLYFSDLMWWRKEDEE